MKNKGENLNEKENSSIDTSEDVSHVLFSNELRKWLEEKGFVNDRGWEKEQESGMMFYSFGKGNIRFEIKLNWHKKFEVLYERIYVQILDCKKEFYSNSGYIGWMGQDALQSFKKPFSRSMFDAICEHYEI